MSSCKNKKGQFTEGFIYKVLKDRLGNKGCENSDQKFVIYKKTEEEVLHPYNFTIKDIWKGVPNGEENNFIEIWRLEITELNGVIHIVVPETLHTEELVFTLTYKLYKTYYHLPNRVNFSYEIKLGDKLLGKDSNIPKGVSSITDILDIADKELKCIKDSMALLCLFVEPELMSTTDLLIYLQKSRGCSDILDNIRLEDECICSKNRKKVDTMDKELMNNLQDPNKWRVNSLEWEYSKWEVTITSYTVKSGYSVNIIDTSEPYGRISPLFKMEKIKTLPLAITQAIAAVIKLDKEYNGDTYEAEKILKNIRKSMF